MLILFQCPTPLPSPIIPLDHSELPRGSCCGNASHELCGLVLPDTKLYGHYYTCHLSGHVKISPLISVLYLSWLRHHKYPHFRMKFTVPHPVQEQIAAEGRCPLRVGMRPRCSPLRRRQSRSERLLLISKDSFLSLADSSSNRLWAKQRQQFFLPSGNASWSRWCPFSLSVPHLLNRGRKMPLGWQGHFYTDSLNIPAALCFQDNSIGVNLVLSPPHMYVSKTTNHFMVLARSQIPCFKYLLGLLLIKELPGVYDSSAMTSIASLNSWSLSFTDTETTSCAKIPRDHSRSFETFKFRSSEQIGIHLPIFDCSPR